MSNSKVYLAGPITGLSFNGCTEWRDWAKQQLEAAGIAAFSPMRAKDYLSHLEKISGTGDEYQHLGVFSNQQAVVTRDNFDVHRCDVLLVNLLGAKSVSIGTMFEMAWAFQKKTPIVCVIEPEGNPHEHMFVREAIGFRVPSLEEAVHAIKAILL
jgi:nucleoside 2-deoxyribosyltransferase